MPPEEIPDADWTQYDMLPVGIIVIRSDYSILFWNDCIADWTGMSASEMIGTNLLQRFPNMNKNVIKGRIDLVFDGGPAAIFSPQFHPHIILANHPNGNLRFQSTKVVPHSAIGELTAMIVIEDVTDIFNQTHKYRELKNVAEKELEERKRAEAEMSRLASIVESSDDAIISKNLDGIITSWNYGAELLFGYAVWEAIGKNVSFLSPADQAEEYLEILQQIKNGNHISHFQTKRVTADRRILDISLTVSPIFDTQGQIIGASSIARDITEAQRMDEALRLANKKLNMLSSITRHDIINQLMALRAYIHLIREEIHDPKPIGFIEKADQIANTIGDQVEFTRAYQDVGVKSPVWQQIPAVITEAILPLQQSGICVDLSGLKPLEIFADPLLQRVFYNLVENAQRHGEHVTFIRFWHEERIEGLVIICEDDGVGVPMEFKEKIFRREYFKHTGFGMYLAREILSLTGITILETGEPDKGARFEMLVPKGAWK